MDAAPIIRESRTLLPIRYVADPLGAQVLWNATEGKVTIKTEAKTFELWINNNTAKINESTVKIDSKNANVTPIIIPPGRTMLPLRFIADNLDCDVIWNATDKSITVTYPK
jgi:titin